VHAQLLIHLLEVVLHGVGGDVQVFADFAIAAPIGHLLHHLQFAGRKSGVAPPCAAVELFGDSWFKVEAALAHGAQRLQHDAVAMGFHCLLQQGAVLVLQEEQAAEASHQLFRCCDQLQARALLEQLRGDQYCGLPLAADLQALVERGAGAEQMIRHQAPAAVAPPFGTHPERGEQSALAAEQNFFLFQKLVEVAPRQAVGHVGEQRVHGCRIRRALKLQPVDELCLLSKNERLTKCVKLLFCLASLPLGIGFVACFSPVVPLYDDAKRRWGRTAFPSSLDLDG
jgi:hypothetical protein